MTSTQNQESRQKEGRLLFAKQAVQNNRISSIRKAATSYDIPRTTLQRRLDGTASQSASNSQKRKLQPSEEKALVEWILSLDRRGFPPQIIDVRRMADCLLAARGHNPPP
jgi:membrane-bound lytic murein transglycosylase B